MELPADVLIHNETLGVKGGRGTLIQITDAYYEVNCQFGERLHRTLFPIQSTVLIAQNPEEPSRFDGEIER